MFFEFTSRIVTSIQLGTFTDYTVEIDKMTNLDNKWIEIIINSRMFSYYTIFI